MEYSELILLLAIVVVMGALIFAFTMGTILRSETKIKSKKPKNPKKSKKKKPEVPGCKHEFGYLHKLKKKVPWPAECWDCGKREECLKGKIPKQKK